MENPVAAVAEIIVDYIRKEDYDGLVRHLKMSDGEWRQELRYEFNLEKMLEAIFRNDILIPKLVLCDIQTISPFHYSALRGVDAILEMFLLQHQIPVDMCVQSGSTALHFACFSGMLDTVKMLVERFHVDINRKDRYGWSPLHYASTDGNLPVIEYLVEHGADISARDKDGTTAAFRAQAFGHVNVVSYFVQSSGDEDLLLVDDSVFDQASLCDDRPTYASIGAVREKKELAGRRSSGSSVSQSDYEMAVTSSSTSTGKQEVANLVRGQLEQIFEGNFDPYMNPVSGGTTQGGKVPLDIGINTLTRILKDEFMKFKTDHDVNKVADDAKDNKRPYIGPSSDYEDISKYGNSIRGIQNIPSHLIPTMDNEDEDDDAPVMDPPPLPPRSISFTEDKDEKQNKERKKKTKNPRIKKKKMDRVNYKTLTLNELARQDPGKTKALIILNRFDNSGTVMQACFQVLVDSMEDGEQWKRLASSLPLRNRQDAVKCCIRNIETRHPGDPKQQALSALQDWRHYFGEAANVDVLIEGMKKCGLDDKIPLVETAALEFTA